MRTLLRKKALLPVLGPATAVAIATAAAAAQGPKVPKFKATRDMATVMKDIKDGKAKKVKEGKDTTAVWDGCKFHYLHTDKTDWLFDDNSMASLNENPEPLPPKDKDCVTTRNPTAVEMAESEQRTAAANAVNITPGLPPLPPLPADRYKGG